MSHLILMFIKLELSIAKKYHIKMIFNLFHLASIVFLFHYISKTFGKIELFNGPYFPFVATGLAFNYLASGLISSSSNKIIEWRENGVLEGLFLTPQSPWQIYLSAGFFEIFSSTIKFLLIVSFVSFFYLKVSFSWQSFSFLLCTLSLVFGIGSCFSLMETSSLLLWKKVSIAGAFGSIFSLFFSGVYFPISILPNFLQWVALSNPFFHALLIVRHTLGIQSPDQNLIQPTHSLALLFSWLILSALVAFLFYRKSESHLFQTGSHFHS